MKLNKEYFRNTDTLWLAKDLLGKVLCTNMGGIKTSGWTSETEAYLGADDRASHAFGNRLTKRTKTLYEGGGISYVYLCYGIHYLFNVVNHQKEVPHAILIRAIQAKDGIEHILKRRNSNRLKPKLLDGPGKVSKALGINKHHNGISLSGGTIWIEDQIHSVNQSSIVAGPRIGVGYAGEDAALPYRFVYQDKF